MCEISVIVPIYNVEPFLEECIDSIISQSFNDIEIILVDDGSSDNSGQIADEYALRDSRIRVLHQDNRGLSAARNTGIHNSCSPYLMFVDSDDYVEQDFCLIPYQYAQKHEADIVAFEYREDPERKAKKNILQDRLLTKDQALMELADMTLSVIIPNKIYRRELFEGIEFPVGRMFEDTGTTYRLLEKANRVYCTNEILYVYRQRGDSIIHSNSKKRTNDRKEMMRQMSVSLLHYFSNDIEKFVSPGVLFVALEYVIANEPSQNPETAKEAKKIINNLKYLSSTLTKKKQIMMFLYTNAPYLFHLICRLYGYR